MIDDLIKKATQGLPPDYEITLVLAKDAWIVDLEVPNRMDEKLGSRRHIATSDDCPLDHAISEAVVIANLLENQDP